MQVITYTNRPATARKNLGGFFIIDWDRNVCLAESKTYIRARNAWRKIMAKNALNHNISIVPLASAIVVEGRLFISGVKV